MGVECRKCHKQIHRLPNGTYLTRVNEFGVTGVWECRPTCGRTIGRTQEHALLDALDDSATEQGG